MRDFNVLYLSRKDVEDINVPMADIVEALEKMFKEKGAGKTDMPPKTAIHTLPDTFINPMPAYIPSLRSAGMKWVSTYPPNPRKGLPMISGLLILNDPDTGIPISVMDCTWITGKRTGAATAVAAKYLARRDSSTVGIVACGVQGRGNLEALTCVFGIDTVKAFDKFPEAAKKFAVDMSEKLGLEVEPVRELEMAVKDMDIVVTSGPISKDPGPAIEAGWLAEGSFASPVDYDSYWKPEALREIDKFATDDKAQMDYYREEGRFKQTPPAYADLGEIAAGHKPGRESEIERTMSMNLGIALDDMATAILIYNKAKERGSGTELPL